MSIRDIKRSVMTSFISLIDTASSEATFNIILLPVKWFSKCAEEAVARGAKRNHKENEGDGVVKEIYAEWTSIPAGCERCDLWT